eukprot:CAMPEP_0179247472 /NCGR_PEP_ID=MMETSP0797-20121207/19628_1 /TAXON_ID=47934 /ORGANISM="Dinophysis acuminata, Strain DAEP01" /LENGTH=233 /DNA_ID=CAMNT_0020955095 /DNA_START=31 /DNA_END=729 /DNA_ORIENTATION=+
MGLGDKSWSDAMNREGDDEDEQLMPRQRAFMGMKFHDEESRATARKVTYATTFLGALVVGHFVIHWNKRGHVAHTIAHLCLGLILPFIGYLGVVWDDNSNWGSRFLWVFHIGNVVFVLVHAMALVVVCAQVMQLEEASVESMCDLSGKVPWLQSGPKVLPSLPSASDDYTKCLEAANEEKQHAPGLLMLWALFSLPYWTCAAFAAYYSHELYFQLRIRELTVRRGAQGGEGGD